MSRRRRIKYLAVCGLLVSLGVTIYIAPMGRSDLQTGTSCGPTAVAALMQEISAGSLNPDMTSEQIKAELRSWDYIPDRIPFIGGATFPWGIKHALETLGLSGRVEVGIDTPDEQEVPFVALILESGRQWHYVAVLEVGKDTVLTNSGAEPADEFFRKWRWSGYWRCNLEHSDKEVQKQ